LLLLFFCGAQEKRAQKSFAHKPFGASASSDGLSVCRTHSDSGGRRLRARSLVTGNADPAYNEALNTIAAADAADSIANLYAEARRTPPPADEAVVGRIEGIEKNIAKTESEITGLRREALVWRFVQRRCGIAQVRDKCLCGPDRRGTVNAQRRAPPSPADSTAARNWSQVCDETPMAARPRGRKKCKNSLRLDLDPSQRSSQTSSIRQPL
jgi:hypothetical protein